MFRRELREDAGCMPRIDLEGLQVPVVHAEHPGPRREGAPEFFLGVHLHERVHAEFFCERAQILHLRRLEDGRYQQNGVRTARAGLENLVFGEDELFSEHGQAHRAAHLFQMRHFAEKSPPLGEHRYGGGPTRLIGPGDFGRLERLGDLPLGGRGLLHLGDDAHPGAFGILARIWFSQRVREIHSRRRILRHRLEVGFCAPSLVRGDVLADAFHEFIENRMRRNRQDFILPGEIDNL